MSAEPEWAAMMERAKAYTGETASFDEVYAFLRDRYLHSRFEGSHMLPSCPDYAVRVARSHLQMMEERGYGLVSMYESRTGRHVVHDRGLNVLNPDEPPAQIQAKAPNLTHIF